MTAEATASAAAMGAMGAAAAEQALHFETADGDSHLAVLTPAAAAAPAAALFIPAEGQTRVGPERLHVRLAREWALLGVPSLRFDAPASGDDPPGPGGAAPAADSARAAAQVLRERYPQARIVLTAFGRAAAGAVRVAAVLAAADLRLHSLCLINPILGDIPLPQPRPWWRRMLGRSQTPTSPAPMGGPTGDDASVWQSLPELLRRNDARLLVVTGGNERAYATLQALAQADRQWRRLLRSGSTLRLDGVDRYLTRPAHWQAVNGWVRRQVGVEGV